jgi:ABC-2 type transport system ATP-binding protein
MSSAISLENIHRSFKNHFWEKKKKILKGISLEVRQSEVFGFLGPNGAGKTTTIKVITGLLRADSGSAEVFGNPAGTIEAKKRIGFLPESPYFYEHLSGSEFLKIHAMLCNRHEKSNDVLRLLEKVGLANAADLQLRKYSRGMLQRIGIAQALIGDPDILILDEPLTGLDPIGRKEVKDLILEEKAKGKTIFFSSHILPDAEAVCDRIGIIIDGKIMAVGELKKLLKRDVKTDEISLEEWFVRQVKEKRSNNANDSE